MAFLEGVHISEREAGSRKGLIKACKTQQHSNSHKSPLQCVLQKVVCNPRCATRVGAAAAYWSSAASLTACSRT